MWACILQDQNSTKLAKILAFILSSLLQYDKVLTFRKEFNTPYLGEIPTGIKWIGSAEQPFVPLLLEMLPFTV